MRATRVAEDLFTSLRKAALGGRVKSTPFLEPDDAASLAAKLREAGVGVHSDGGYTGARRRVVTAFPEHIPEASAAFAALYYEGVAEDDLRVALGRTGLAEGSLGDALEHQDGVTFVVLAADKESALAPVHVAGQRVAPQEVDPAHLGRGSNKSQTVVVPSLRVDALGAKAFKVSRSYFSKGVAGGRVRVNGLAAGKSSSAALGDEVYAEGLGRFTVTEVLGETKKGNLKVTLEIER